MRCPKCEYLAFEPGDRCRHCGYEFALAADSATKTRPDDLPIRLRDESGPLTDLPIRNGGAKPGAVAVPRFVRTPAPASDLPLFSEAEVDEPVVAAPPPPRPPLAVRRATPDPLRLRGRPPRRAVEEPVLGFESPGEPPEVATGASDVPEPASADDPQAGILSEPTAGEERARPAQRLLGAAVDVLLVVGVDVAVVYFTLGVAGLTLAEASTLPVVPMVAFFLVLNGGYVAAFTAVSGRTIGKMVAGTAVTRQDGGHVSFGQALLRTGGYLLSALPVGLGFVLGLVGARLALHDRLAGTHVIPT